MDPLLFKALGLLLVFSGVFMCVYVLAPAGKTKGSVTQFEQGTTLGENTRLVMAFSPAFPLLRPLIALAPLEGYRTRLRKIIASAGLDRELSVVDFMAFQLACMLLFALLGLVLWKEWIIAVFVGLIGGGYAYLWLWEKKKSRQQEIALSMPNIVDMLSLSVEAGLDFLAAIKRIGEVGAPDGRAKDPFIQELQLMYHNIKLGMSTEEALLTMADRVDIQEMHSFVSIIVQAHKMGSSIADVLHSQAVRMRQQRFMKAERMGAVASQKLLIPMMLCIFPILFIIIFAPYILKFIYGR